MKPHNNRKFIPPKEDDYDYSFETDDQIQNELDRLPKETDIRDEYGEEDNLDDPNDLKDVL